MGGYQYTIIKELGEIRLIVLSPGSQDDVISCELISVPFGESHNPTYEAISYVRGNATEMVKILVD